jgi:hypothetical protein
MSHSNFTLAKSRSLPIRFAKGVGCTFSKLTFTAAGFFLMAVLLVTWSITSLTNYSACFSIAWCSSEATGATGFLLKFLDSSFSFRLEFLLISSAFIIKITEVNKTDKILTEGDYKSSTGISEI